MFHLELFFFSWTQFSRSVPPNRLLYSVIIVRGYIYKSIEHERENLFYCVIIFVRVMGMYVYCIYIYIYVYMFVDIFLEIFLFVLI